jgi:hypothetical protein
MVCGINIRLKDADEWPEWTNPVFRLGQKKKTEDELNEATVIKDVGGATGSGDSSGIWNGRLFYRAPGGRGDAEIGVRRG